MCVSFVTNGYFKQELIEFCFHNSLMNDQLSTMLCKEDLLNCALLSKKVWDVVSKVIISLYYFRYVVVVVVAVQRLMYLS